MTIGVELVVRAGGTVAGANLGGVAQVDSLAADGVAGLEGVGGAKHTVSRAVVSDIAVASRVTAEDPGWLERIGRALDAEVVAHLGGITGASGGAASYLVSSKLVIWAVGGGSVAVLDLITGSGLGTAGVGRGLDEVGGTEGIDTSAVLGQVTVTHAGTTNSGAVEQGLLALALSGANSTLTAIQVKVLLAVGIDSALRRVLGALVSVG
jgi:hypothetical protein